MRRILITGSRGYIGSTVAKTFAEQGIVAIGVDRETRGDGSNQYGMFYRTNFESNHTAELICDLSIDTVCHLAADASVPDSVANPLTYYQNNVAATIQLLDNLVKRKWKGKIIFSSSAAVYPDINSAVSECVQPQPCNPYGRSKLMGEQILLDAYNSYGISSVCFRYFNVAGAWDDVGDHYGSDHVIQKLIKSALEKKRFVLFADDKKTVDGSCVRDFLHVRDVADAHLAAIDYLNKYPGFYTYNLGTSQGTSIKQLIRQFVQTTKHKLEFEIGDGRPGDPDYLVADGHKFTADTGYTYKHSDLSNIISTAWEYSKGKKK